MTAFGRRTKPTAALKMPSDTAHGAEEASLRCSTTDHRNVIGKWSARRQLKGI